MGAYFVLGSITSLAALGLVGAVTTGAIQATVALLPFMLGGFALSGPARRLLDRGWIRPAVLLVLAVSAAVLMVKALL